MNPLLLTDAYKTGHHKQYPEGTTLVYSNFTPRSNKYAPKGYDHVVSFGMQAVFKFIDQIFVNDFFKKPKEEVCGEMKRELSLYLNTDYDVSHFEALHDLGYLPICVKTIEEGSLVPMKVPVLTIYNTHPDFFWVTNYLETLISNLLWKPLTSATIAFQYKKLLTEWALKTDKENVDFVDFQAHDFSMRGLSGIDCAVFSGLGHLTSFKGTDSLPAIWGARQFYGMIGSKEDPFIAGSVNATEHSVMCAGGKEDELETFRRLLSTYPTGILSIVSDTWDLWKVLTEYLPILRNEIMARDGKIVIRPDSGKPTDIICGDSVLKYENLKKAKDKFEQNIHDMQEHGEQGDDEYDCISKIGDKFYKLNAEIEWNRYDKQYYHIEGIRISEEEYYLNNKEKGVIELLWDIFGGTVNSQGYKVLDPHIGAIYGDSITLEVAEDICQRLQAKGFASTNIIFGIGSFTYQMNTRDTFGFAMKSTYVEINGQGHNIFKDPITDDGMKKSATGLLGVGILPENKEFILVNGCSWEVEKTGSLQEIYRDGNFSNQTNLENIRKKLKERL